MNSNFQANKVESCNEEDRRKVYYLRRTKEKRKISREKEEIA